MQTNTKSIRLHDIFVAGKWERMAVSSSSVTIIACKLLLGLSFRVETRPGAKSL